MQPLSQLVFSVAYLITSQLAVILKSFLDSFTVNIEENLANMKDLLHYPR